MFLWPLRIGFDVEYLLDVVDALEEFVDFGWCRPLGDHVVGVGHCSADCIELLVHPGQAVVGQVLVFLKRRIDDSRHALFHGLDGFLETCIELFLGEGHRVEWLVNKG